MRRGFTLTPSAKADLREIVQYYRRERGVASARLVRTTLDTALMLLATHPEIGHARPDLADERHRIWPVRHFLIIYRPQTKPLQIIRIWHAKRGTPQLA